MPIFSFKPATKGHLDPLHDMRVLCRDLLARKKENDGTLSHITMVGTRPQNGRLDRLESARLEHAILACAFVGWPVSPSFELLPLDKTEGSEQDFLNPAFRFPTDLLVVSYLLDPPPGREKFFPDQVSPFYTPEAWARSAAMSGTTVIVTFGGHIEIMGNAFIEKREPLFRQVLYRPLPPVPADRMDVLVSTRETQCRP